MTNPTNDQKMKPKRNGMVIQQRDAFHANAVDRIRTNPIDRNTWNGNVANRQDFVVTIARTPLIDRHICRIIWRANINMSAIDYNSLWTSFNIFGNKKKQILSYYDFKLFVNFKPAFIEFCTLNTKELSISNQIINVIVVVVINVKRLNTEGNLLKRVFIFRF